jgi:ABC-type multidrug transport system ATPase subunit
VIKSILGLTTPTSGEISVFGKNLYLERNKIMRNVGAVVEAPALFPDFSALENLTFLTRLSENIPKKRIMETLDVVGLGHVGKQRVGTFSYGMKQRLGIAQALLPDNKLIFLDEPTNGLDPHGILGVRKLIRRLCNELGITVFLSSHLLSEVEQVCDSVTIIDKGVKICESKVSDLVTEREHIEVIVIDIKAFVELAEKDGLNIIRQESLEGSEQYIILLEGKEEDIPELNRKLVKNKIDIFRITKHQNTLEEIFVELTGQDSAPSVSDRF